MRPIEISGLSKRFGGVTALNDLSAHLPAGAHCLVVGPSGSGKSTLLRILAGLESPDSGSVRAGDDDFKSVPIEKRGCGWVGQNPGLLPHLSVMEQWTLVQRFHGAASGEAQERAREMARLLRLTDRLSHRPAALSGGEASRAALGRALIQQPGILLLDEPFSHLDAPLRAEASRLVAELHVKHGFTLVHVTHHPVDSCVDADHVLCLEAGRCIQSGRPDELYRAPLAPWIASLFGGDALWTCPVDRIDQLAIQLDPAYQPESGARLIGIRTDAVTLHRARPSGSSLGPATVRRVAQIGARLRLRVAWGESESMLLTADRNADDGSWETGDPVWVGMPPGSVLWF